MTSIPVPSLPRTSSPLDAVKGSGVVVPAVACVVAIALASLSLAPVLESGAWFGPVMTVTLVVVGVGALAMWVRIPLFLVPVLQVVALFSVLVAKYATSAVWGFLPSTDSLSELRTVLTQGMHDINVYAPPVPVSPGVAAVAALGIGCLAIVVFVLQVALRMPVVAGLALVGIYVVPSFVLEDGSPWWSFAALAVAFMVLLISDERVGLVGWGRMLRRSEGASSSPLSGLSSAALRIGATAIVAAVAIPIVVPGIADAVLNRGSGSGQDPRSIGDGPGTTGLGVNPFVELRRRQISQSNAPVLSYRGDGKTGYLPTVVLTTYKDEAWSASPFTKANAAAVADGVPLDTSSGPVFADPAGKRRTTFTAAAAGLRYLPVPEHFTGIQVKGGDTQWYVDYGTRSVFAEASATDSLSWTVDWNSSQPTAEQLQNVQPTTFNPDELRSRPKISQRILDLANKIVEQSGAETPYAEARAIQDFFTNKGKFTGNRFQYSLDVQDPSNQSGTYLDQFLDEQKGYCQQYAATMALLAEAMGIRSRVVVGYTQGAPQPDGTFVVQDHDAHAWPELSFSGIGWVRFEPTPGGGLNGTVAAPPWTLGQVKTGSSESASASGGSNCAGRGENSCRSPEDAALGKRVPAERSGSPDAAPGVDEATSADTWRLRGILALLLVGAVIAAVPALVRWLRRRRRLSEQAAIEDMWEELRDTARDLGIPWSTAQTPRQAVAGLIAHEHLRRDVAEAATRVGRATERSRYAPSAPSTDGVADDVETVRRALWRRADRGQKWRAALLPASLRDSEDART